MTVPARPSWWQGILWGRGQLRWYPSWCANCGQLQVPCVRVFTFAHVFCPPTRTLDTRPEHPENMRKYLPKKIIKTAQDLRTCTPNSTRIGPPLCWAPVICQALFFRYSHEKQDLYLDVSCTFLQERVGWSHRHELLRLIGKFWASAVNWAFTGTMAQQNNSAVRHRISQR